MKKIQPGQRLDPLTNRTIFYINLNENDAVRPYVTQTQWDREGKQFLVGNPKEQMLYLYSIETGELIKIGECEIGSICDAMITPDNKVFFNNARNKKIQCYEIENGKVTTVGNVPENVKFQYLEVSNDGKYMSGYWLKDEVEDQIDGEARYHILPILDTENGKWDTRFQHWFNEGPDPFFSLGHPIINPVYKNLYFFCHEGKTEYIRDRLWLLDMDTGVQTNLYIQAENEELIKEGLTGETSGHENWSVDGEYLYFVKYPYLQQNLGQSGLVRIRKDGRIREYFNGDYQYWHCTPSPDQNWVVSESQIGNRTEIVMVNTRTYKSYLLCSYPMVTGNHPRQPHPVFSQDGTKVSFQMDDENGTLSIGWVDVTDVIAKMPEGGRINLNEQLELVSYEGCDSEIHKTSFAGEECYLVPQGKSIYVALKELGEKEDLKINITFYDQGSQLMHAIYTSIVNNREDYAQRENKEVLFRGNRSLQWQSKQILLRKINLNHPCKYQTDFKIFSDCSNIYIKNIEIVE